MGTHPIFESDFDCLTDNINRPQWQKRRKSQRKPRRRPPLEEVKNPKRSGLRKKFETSSLTCAYSTKQHTIKYSKKYLTTRSLPHQLYLIVRRSEVLWLVVPSKNCVNLVKSSVLFNITPKWSTLGPSFQMKNKFTQQKTQNSHFQPQNWFLTIKI